jgi:2-polyprenyl-3-methyl-5-hydroxy-6-metoxy-1,4-benzoquinol methylase
MYSVRAIEKAYDGSTATYKLLRACGWGLLLNVGYFHFLDWFRAPFRFDRAQLRLLKRVIRLLDLQQNERVLDVGCGRGWSSYLIAMLNPSCTITAIDILAANMAVAESMYGQVHNLDFYPGTASNLTFDNSSFDKIISLDVGFYCDRERFIRESFRLLSPGGVCVITDIVWRDPSCRKIVPVSELAEVKNIWKFDDCAALQEYIRFAKRAGFRILSKNDWTPNTCGALERRFRYLALFSRISPMRKVIFRSNRLLENITDEQWGGIRRSAKAHHAFCKQIQHVCLVLKKP